MTKHSSYSSRVLVEMIQGESQKRGEAITHIFKEMLRKKTILKFILNSGGTEEDAKDLLQEGMCAFIENIEAGKFRGESNIFTYLTSICKYTWWRPSPADSSSSLDSIVESSPPPDGFGCVQLLRVCLDKIGEKCKKMLLWRREDPKVPWEEIAEMLDYKNAQVAMTKGNRCFKKLCECYKKYDC